MPSNSAVALANLLRQLAYSDPSPLEKDIEQAPVAIFTTAEATSSCELQGLQFCEQGLKP